MGALQKFGSMIGNLTGFGISLTDATEQWVPSNQTFNFSQYQGQKLRKRIFMVSVMYAEGFGGFDKTDLQNLLKAYEEKAPLRLRCRNISSKETWSFLLQLSTRPRMKS